MNFFEITGWFIITILVVGWLCVTGGLNEEPASHTPSALASDEAWEDWRIDYERSWSME